jgi:hypothetical protein
LDIEVSAREAIEGRPVTEPARSEADFEIMGFMLQMLRDTPPSEWTWIGQGHQAFVSQPEALGAAQEMIVVGFFGHMQPGAQADTLPQIQAVDAALIAQFPTFPGLYSYTSLQLPGGDWANLAVFSDLNAMDEWSANPTHVRAIKDIAPRHYDTIRLHVGRLQGGLNGQLSIFRTRFYQYEEDSIWRGCCRRQA